MLLKLSNSEMNSNKIKSKFDTLNVFSLLMNNVQGIQKSVFLDEE